ncbi:MAG: O-antigen ligase family protein [Candidatus Buchananbacteria bacterium]|jgi:hypothetical protein
MNHLEKFINWIVIAFVFLLPWQIVYIFNEKFINGAKSQFLTGQLYVTELILMLIVILYLINNFRLSKLKEKLDLFDTHNKKNLFILSIWLFIAYSGLSILWSADFTSAYYLWLHLLEGAGLLLIILTFNISKTKLLWAVLFSAGLQGLLAIQQFLSQSISANKWLGIAHHSAGILGDIVVETSSGRWLRAYGSFGHPNILGGWLILGIACGFLLWLEYFKSSGKLLPKNLKLNDPQAKIFLKRWLKILLVLILSLVASAGLFFSFSRSAWLALVLIFLAFIFSSIRLMLALPSPKEIFQFLLLPIGIIIIFASQFFIFNSLVLIRADTNNRLEAISKNERIDQIGESWRIIKKSPLTGIGINNYTLALNKIAPNQPAYDLQPVHNIYLLIVSELGIIGLILFIFFILIAILLIHKNSKSLLLISIFPLFLIISLFDHYLWTTYAGIVIFWLALTFNLKSDNVND